MTGQSPECPECGPQGGRGYLTLFLDVVPCKVCHGTNACSTYYVYCEDHRRRYTCQDGTKWGSFLEDVRYTATSKGLKDVNEFFLASMSARHHNMSTQHANVRVETVEHGVMFYIEMPSVSPVEGFCVRKA